MELTAEQIQSQWDKFIGYINEYISPDRAKKLVSFYEQHKEEIMLMPASHKKAYHNCFPGGYIDHVNRVVECALKLTSVWSDMGINKDTFTLEEVVFSAINHDLGKMGDGEEYAHVPSTDQWRKKNLGEMYTFNTKISYMSVPDRSIYLLTSNNIEVSPNEWLGIKLHDGLYDPANEPYYKTYLPETKPRTSLPFIIHHADMMATRIEFEREWLPKFNTKTSPSTPNVTKKKPSAKRKALSSVSSPGLKNMLDNL